MEKRNFYDMSKNPTFFLSFLSPTRVDCPGDLFSSVGELVEEGG